MSQGPPSGQACTALVPYRPHFFPIPWKSSNEGTFTSAQLQPIQIPVEDGASSSSAPYLPRFELNLKVANMLARRATIMNFLNNGEPEIQNVASTNGQSKSTPPDPRITPRSSPSNSSTRLPHPGPPTSRFQDHRTDSHVQPKLDAHPRHDLTPSRHSVTSSSQRQIDNDATSLFQAHGHESESAPPSSLYAEDFDEDEYRGMIPAYSQDYVVQCDDEEEEEVTTLDFTLGSTFDDDGYARMDEEAMLNDAHQPFLPDWHGPHNQSGGYEEGVDELRARSSQDHEQIRYISNIQDTDEIDFTTPHYGHYIMRYEECNHPRGADFYMEQGALPHACTNEDGSGRYQQADAVTENFGPAQEFDLANSDAMGHDAIMPTYRDYLPKHIEPDEPSVFDSSMDMTVDFNHDLPPSSPPKHDPSIEQWRVGKISGHQGSYSRRGKEDSPGGDGPRGTKRTLNADIEHTAERVLKKPFVPPRPVIKPSTAPVPDLIDLSGDEADPALSPPSVPKSRKPAPFPLIAKAPNSTIPSISSRLSKPFKTPARAIPTSASQDSPSKIHSSTPVSTAFHRSLAPSPQTNLGSSPTKAMNSTPISRRIKRSSPTGVVLLPSSSAKPSLAQADKTKILHLESRLRLLKEAINYENNPEEEDEISNLAEQWLAAGRDIAERLFERIPQPDEVSRAPSQTLDWGVAKGGGWSRSRGEVEMSHEEKEFLKNVRRDDDGDPVDEEGNKLIEDVSEGDLLSALRSSTGGGGGPYRPSTTSFVQYADVENRNVDTDRPNPAALSTNWTIGTMLDRLKIDPLLLGWDAENESWIEGEF